MKKFSLKKITAAVSAAAMIATMGTTAFAYEKTTDVETVTGSGINITKVQCLDTDKDGIFDVEIGYTTTSAHELGATMLTYGNAGNTPLESGDFTDTTNMKIVGVDQSESVGANESKTFNFKVSAIPSTTNSYYLKRGVTALVAISGSSATAKSVAQLQLDPLTATSATVDFTDPVSVEYYNYEDVKTKIAQALATASKTVNVAAVGTAIDEKTKEPLESYTATYAFDGNETVKEGTGENAGKYYVTIPTGASLTGPDASCITVGEGLKVEVPVTPTIKPWVGNALALKEGASVVINKRDIAEDDTNAAKAVKAALNDKLVITDGTNKADAYVNDAIAVEPRVDATYDKDSTEVQELKFKVTATNAIAKDGETTVATLASGTIDELNVTVKSLADNEFVVARAKATKDGKDVTEVTVANGTSKDDAITALNGKFDNITVADASDNITESGWTTVGNWTITKVGGGDYNKDDEGEATYTASIAIKAPTTRGDYHGVNDGGVELTLTLKVSEKVKGMYGDLVGAFDEDGNEIGDGRIKAADVNAVFQASKGKRTLTPEQFWAADVATKPADGRIKAADVNLIFQASKGKLPNGKFPVEE